MCVGFSKFILDISSFFRMVQWNDTKIAQWKELGFFLPPLSYFLLIKYTQFGTFIVAIRDDFDDYNRMDSWGQRMDARSIRKIIFVCPFGCTTMVN